MRLEKWFCDKCGEEVERKGFLTQVRLNGTLYADLCEDCLEEVEAFIKPSTHNGGESR